MFAYTKETLDEAESVARDGSIADALRALRKLPLSDFGEFMWMLPAKDYPHLSMLLPKMADVDVQNAWTGANGHTLLVQTTDFIKTLACAVLRLTGRDLRGGGDRTRLRVRIRADDSADVLFCRSRFVVGA